MKHTIEDLWNGNIAPCEHCGSHDPAINELVCLMERHSGTLQGQLGGQQWEIFEKYRDASDEYLLRLMERAFCEGFCLGAKLAAEALSG